VVVVDLPVEASLVAVTMRRHGQPHLVLYHKASMHKCDLLRGHDRMEEKMPFVLYVSLLGGKELSVERD
jgi:hypothetical protein